jgi:Protein of unknown function (DUF3667)
MGEIIPESKSSTNCLNCGEVVADDFCSKCGQPGKTGRLNIKTLFKGVLEGFFDLEKPLYRTIIGLTIHPGKVVSEYVSGKRKTFANPVKYMLSTSALLMLITKYQGSVVDSIQENSSVDPNVPESVAFFQTQMMEFLQAMQPYDQIFNLILTPWLAVLLFMFFKKSNYRVTEHMAFGFLVMGHMAFMFSVVMLFNYQGMFYKQILLLQNIVPPVYMTWCIITFNKSKVIAGVFKSLVVWFLFVMAIPVVAMIYILIKMQIV